MDFSALIFSEDLELCFLFIGHGGSDGLHGYVPSLDHVVADTVSLIAIPFVSIIKL